MPDRDELDQEVAEFSPEYASSDDGSVDSEDNNVPEYHPRIRFQEQVYVSGEDDFPFECSTYRINEDGADTLLLHSILRNSEEPVRQLKRRALPTPIADGPFIRGKGLNSSSKFSVAAAEDEDRDRIQVVCRLRPLLGREASQTRSRSLTVPDAGRHGNAPDTVDLSSEKVQPQSFTFDRVFPSTSTQPQIYDHVGVPTIRDLLLGYNATIFCYGMTSSGKSYTMFGSIDDIYGDGEVNDVIVEEDGTVSDSALDESIDDSKFSGLIPRVARGLFEALDEAETSKHFLVAVSFFELYMEELRDLLNPSAYYEPLQIREDSKHHVSVQGLSSAFVTSADEMLSLLRSGLRFRHTAHTEFNVASSRSHALFKITLSQRTTSGEIDDTKTSSLFLVDLAGSEKAQTAASFGDGRLMESSSINRSLTTLGLVMKCLAERSAAIADNKSPKSLPHVPYRDSKLTRMLKESLGGNARTTLICNCSPSMLAASENQSTLKFGQRAKNIRNRPRVNRELSPAQMKKTLEHSQRQNALLSERVAKLEAQLRQITAGEVDLNISDGDRALVTSPTSVDSNDSTSAITVVSEAELSFLRTTASDAKERKKEISEELVVLKEQMRRQLLENVAMKSVLFGEAPSTVKTKLQELHLIAKPPPPDSNGSFCGSALRFTHEVDRRSERRWSISGLLDDVQDSDFSLVADASTWTHHSASDMCDLLHTTTAMQTDSAYVRDQQCDTSSLVPYVDKLVEAVCETAERSTQVYRFVPTADVGVDACPSTPCEAHETETVPVDEDTVTVATADAAVQALPTLASVRTRSTQLSPSDLPEASDSDRPTQTLSQGTQHEVHWQEASTQVGQADVRSSGGAPKREIGTQVVLSGDEEDPQHAKTSYFPNLYQRLLWDAEIALVTVPGELSALRKDAETAVKSLQEWKARCTQADAARKEAIQKADADRQALSAADAKVERMEEEITQLQSQLHAGNAVEVHEARIQTLEAENLRLRADLQQAAERAQSKVDEELEALRAQGPPSETALKLDAGRDVSSQVSPYLWTNSGSRSPAASPVPGRATPIARTPSASSVASSRDTVTSAAAIMVRTMFAEFAGKHRLEVEAQMRLSPAEVLEHGNRGSWILKLPRRGGAPLVRYAALEALNDGVRIVWGAEQSSGRRASVQMKGLTLKFGEYTTSLEIPASVLERFKKRINKNMHMAISHCGLHINCPERALSVVLDTPERRTCWYNILTRNMSQK